MSVASGCLRKRRYANRKQAAQARRAMQQRYGQDHGQPYACRYGCGGWHLGHRS